MACILTFQQWQRVIHIVCVTEGVTDILARQNGSIKANAQNLELKCLAGRKHSSKSNQWRLLQPGSMITSKCIRSKLASFKIVQISIVHLERAQKGQYKTGKQKARDTDRHITDLLCLPTCISHRVYATWMRVVVLCILLCFRRDEIVWSGLMQRALPAGSDKFQVPSLNANRCTSCDQTFTRLQTLHYFCVKVG